MTLRYTCGVGVGWSLFFAVAVIAGGDELFAILRFFRFPV